VQCARESERDGACERERRSERVRMQCEHGHPKMHFHACFSVCVCAGVCVIAVALQQLQTITQLYAMPQPQTHKPPTHHPLRPSAISLALTGRQNRILRASIIAHFSVALFNFFLFVVFLYVFLPVVAVFI